jgi:hypothetical protein
VTGLLATVGSVVVSKICAWFRNEVLVHREGGLVFGPRECSNDS